MADFIVKRLHKLSKSKKFGGRVGVAGGNCIVILVVVGRGGGARVVVVGCSGLCSEVVMVGVERV